MVKVILREHVANLGEMGATVKVPDGYARNYLLPRKLAVQADSGSAKQIEHELRIIRKREEKIRAVLTEDARKLEAVTVEIRARAGEDDRLFGSVTTAHIAEQLKALGHEVDRRTITIEEPIKAVGIYSVAIRLAKDIEPRVKVWVVKEEEEEGSA